MKYETNLQRQLFTVLHELGYLQEHSRSEAEDQDAAPSNAETTSDQ
jgi:Zn-dependent peptidase ImmA (M78 family)